MNEEDTFKEKSETASCFGNLTMEKVIKDENDQHKTGSLVFRIKRTFSETNNDSGIKCSSPSSDEMSNEMSVGTSLSPIRVKIPKALLAEAESVLRLGKNGCLSSEDLTEPEKDVDSSVFNNVTLDTVNSDPISTNTVNCIFEDKVKFRKRIRRTGSRFSVPMESRRRSRRIVHLRLQKECQPVPAKIVKRRQKRKVVSKVVEPRKRKYARRGRPPKLFLESNPDIKKQSWPNSSGSNVVNTENATLPSKNSVWTLVPGSFFKSEFFKSQVLKVRPIQPLEQIRFLTPEYYPPPTMTQPVLVPRVSNTRIRINCSRNIATCSNMSEDNSKRPTVIYFRKNFNAYLSNQSVATNLHNERNNRTESMKKKDLLHLSDKYRMLDYAIIKNAYELNGCNVTETYRMLSNFFSSNLVTSEEIIENANIKQDSVSGVEPTSANSSQTEKADIAPSALSYLEDTHSLCCNVIIESLNILFSEEAVLS